MNNKTVIIGINSVDSGSTGLPLRRSLEFVSKALGCDYEIIAFYGDNKPNCYLYSQPFSFYARFMHHFRIPQKLRWPLGTYHNVYTNRIVRRLKRALSMYETVVVNLNNMHDGTVNNRRLFRFLRKHNIKTIYTLHDCWPFTGGCYYYGNGEVSCDKWKNGCHGCPIHLPRTARTLRGKTSELIGRDNVILMPTSFWLGNEAKESVLGSLPIYPVHSETGLVPPSTLDPSYRDKWGIPKNNKIVISVCAIWHKWKGLDYVYPLADRLPPDYTLLIVGNLDKKGRKNIVTTGFVPDEELPMCYSIADCFVSLTQQETLGLVLPEAEMCGVPVVGFGHGGTVESVNEKTSIMVGTDNDVDKLVQALVYVVEQKPFKKEDIVAAGMAFSKDQYGARALPIYHKLLGL